MQANNPPKIGETIQFSNYNWQVLDIKDGQALLISKLVLEERAYHEKDEPITWENCTLRRYLNGEFYNKLSDKNKIAKHTISNKNNQWYGTDGGNDTTDHIFLLSLEELVQYFGDSGKLKNRPNSSTWYINDQFNKNCIAYNPLGSAAWWWLRSPGYRSFFATFVNRVGYVYVQPHLLPLVGWRRSPCLVAKIIAENPKNAEFTAFFPVKKIFFKKV